MKLIAPARKLVESDPLKKVTAQVRQLLPFGKTDEYAEDAIIARFMRGLDNRFIMLRNIPMERPNEYFPPILIGPPGMMVLNISNAKGFFRAKEDTWWEMSATSRRFSPARPNLIKQSQAYAQMLAETLEARGRNHPDITPVLIFANPGVHIESSNPTIRIVLMDGVENLITGFFNSDELLEPLGVSYLSDSLELMVTPEKAIPIGEGEDFFGRDLFVPEKKAPPKLPSIPIPTELPLKPVEEKLKFTKRQSTILMVMLTMTILVLLITIAYVLLLLRP